MGAKKCLYIFFFFLLSLLPLLIIPVEKFSLHRIVRVRVMSLARSQHASISQNHTSPLRYGKNKFPKPLGENLDHRFVEGARFGSRDSGGWWIKGLDRPVVVLGWWWVATLRSQGDGRSDLTFVVMAPMKCVYLHCLHPSNLISHS